MSTLKVTYLQQASSASPNITLDASTNATVAGTLAMGSSFKRNRIINGNMAVNQRNTAVTATGYTVDRWQFVKSNDATESVAQNTDAPTGFSYSLRDTISVADTSIGSTQYAGILQNIEGYNVADLGFGTANAKTITVSFWVKATQTGSYTCVIQNGGTTRRCFKAYSVSSSNTWEYKTLTFSGDTDTGSSWDTTNGTGFSLQFYYALGSSFLNGTDGTWAAAATNNYGPSGMANGLSTNGNIFAITGVQLEVGSIATPYERQIYNEQLAQCQRYYYRMKAEGVASTFCTGFNDSTTVAAGATFFPVQMRIAPTALEQSGTATDYRVRYTGGANTICSAVPTISAATGTVNTISTAFTVASGLTAGQGNLMQAATANAYLGWSAEL